MIISIVTFNSYTIFECLKNLDQAGDFRIKVFDNNSNEEFKAQLRDFLNEFKGNLELFFNNENLGFGGAHNKNLENENEDYAIIFNPDVKATHDQIKVLKKYMDENPNVVMVAPKILNVDGTQQYLVREKLTLFDFFLRRQPFGVLREKIFNKRLEKFECKNIPDDRVSQIKISSGCFMFVKLDIFKQIGGFDDRFFMYFEDYDLCNRLRKHGEIVYYPFVAITHFYERGSHKSKHLFKIFVSSMLKYFNKWGWKLF